VGYYLWEVIFWGVGVMTKKCRVIWVKDTIIFQGKSAVLLCLMLQVLVDMEGVDPGFGHVDFSFGQVVF